MERDALEELVVDLGVQRLTLLPRSIAQAVGQLALDGVVMQQPRTLVVGVEAPGPRHAASVPEHRTGLVEIAPFG